MDIILEWLDDVKNGRTKTRCGSGCGIYKISSKEQSALCEAVIFK
jgi:hypothetical protein